jgi:hypothetical protein
MRILPPTLLLPDAIRTLILRWRFIISRKHILNHICALTRPATFPLLFLYSSVALRLLYCPIIKIWLFLTKSFPIIPLTMLPFHTLAFITFQPEYNNNLRLIHRSFNSSNCFFMPTSDSFVLSLSALIRAIIIIIFA